MYSEIVDVERQQVMEKHTTINAIYHSKIYALATQEWTRNKTKIWLPKFYSTSFIQAFCTTHAHTFKRPSRATWAMRWATMTVNFTMTMVAAIVITPRLLQLLTGTRDAHLRQPFKTRLHEVWFIHPPPPPFISLTWGLREERSLSTCSVLSWYVLSFTAITYSPRPKPKQCSQGRGGSLLWQTPSTHKESSTTHYFFSLSFVNEVSNGISS
jgi:hypothetical protein